jgi:hypothetical protein
MTNLYITIKGIIVSLYSTEIYKAYSLFIVYESVLHKSNGEFCSDQQCRELFNRIDNNTIQIPLPLFKSKIRELKSIYSNSNIIIQDNVSAESYFNVNNHTEGNILLRDYQSEALRNTLCNNYGIIQLPTGTGKSEIILSLADYLSNIKCYKVLII